MADVKSSAVSAAPLIPRHVAALCQLAERAGLSVGPLHAARSDYDQFEEKEEAWWHLVCTWSGPGRQFFDTGIFTPGQRRVLESPLAIDTHLASPPGLFRWSFQSHMPLVVGRAFGSASRMTWEVDFGQLPISIENRDGCEVVTTPDFVSWHGSAADLHDAGIEGSRLPTGKRLRRTSAAGGGTYDSELRHDSEIRSSLEAWLRYTAKRWWGSRRLPDGSFLYMEDTENGFKRREVILATWTEDSRRSAQEHRGFEIAPAARVAPAPARSFLRLVVDNTRGDSPSL